LQPFDPISQPEGTPPAEEVLPLEIVPAAETTAQEAVILPPLPGHAPVSKEVDLVDVVLIASMAVLCFFIFGAIAVAIFMGAHKGKHIDPQELATNVFFILPTEFVMYLAILGFMAFVVSIRHQMALFKAIHWNPPGRRMAMNAIIIGFVVTFVSEIGVIALNRWVPKTLPITGLFRDRPSAVFLALFAILVAPFMEEIFFRGFLYPALARWIGSALSILVTTCLFTLLHGAQLGYSWAALVPIFIVGAALTITRAVTDSVATTVIIHMTYNFALMAETFAVTRGFTQLTGQ